MDNEKPQSHGNRLDPGTPTHAAVKRVLLPLLDVIERETPGVQRSIDIEHLHDFRVAVRRTRSLIKQLKGVFPAEITDRYRAEFGWLGKISGPARDLDVCLEDLDTYQTDMPSEGVEQVMAWRNYLQAKQAAEYASLDVALGSGRFLTLTGAWRAFLADLSPPAKTYHEAFQPVGEFSRGRITRAHQKLLQRGREIQADPQPFDLHELRKLGKKLRYLIELFRPLYPPEPIGIFVDALKKLQDNLGRIQDLQVQQELLQQYSGSGPKQPRAGRENALAPLLDMLEDQQLQTIRRFTGIFAGFDSKDNRQHFEDCF